MGAKQKKQRMKALDGRLRQVIDPGVAKALSHPLRGHILVRLGERVASPNEIAKELGLAARDLDYHVKVLLEVGMIRLVHKKKRRGVKEHFYELAPPVLHIDDRAWQSIPGELRVRFSTDLLHVMVDDAVAALRAGTFNARNSHQSRTPMILDEQGWHDVTEVMSRALNDVLDVRQESERRRKAATERGIPVEVLMMSFETAAGAGQEA
jgi:DNA-binding transcriptional ArsR family regulator